MANERQIAANRRNAEKSKGPRSLAGKNRSSKNAIKHGLSRSLSGAEFVQQVDALSRRMIGDNRDPTAIELARSAAAAELETMRVRLLKADLINGIVAAGKPDGSEQVAMPLRDSSARKFKTSLCRSLENDVPTAAEAGPIPTAEAIRRALPELLRFTRYEARAAGRKTRAICALARLGSKPTNE